MTQQNSLQVVDAQVVDLPREDTSSAALILSGDSMERALRFAELMASGRATVPQHLQKNPGDCLAITIQAMQWRMNPFAVAQKTHLVNGALGYEAQLVNAVIVTSGAIVGRPDYEWEGEWKGVQGKNSNDDALAATVSATVKGESAPRRLRVSMAQVGTVRNSPLWVNDPRQQLAYLALKRWARLHTPDVMLGVYTTDEREEQTPTARNMGRAEVVQHEPAAELLKEAEAAVKQGLPAYQKFWQATGRENRSLLAGRHDQFKADAEANTPKPAATPAPAADASPEVAAANVYACLQAAFEAGSMDELNVAADMIRCVADASQQDALRKEFAALRETLEGDAL